MRLRFEFLIWAAAKMLLGLMGSLMTMALLLLIFQCKGCLYVAPELTCNLSKIILVIVQNITIILIIIYY